MNNETLRAYWTSTFYCNLPDLLQKNTGIAERRDLLYVCNTSENVVQRHLQFGDCNYTQSVQRR